MNKPEIRIEIYTAKALSFQVSDDEEFEDNLNNENIDLELNSEFQIDTENSAIALKILFKLRPKNQQKDIISLTSFFEFGVFKMEDILVKKDESVRLDSNFARKLMNIAIGGSRGMLSVYLSSTKYKDFVLPIANLRDDLFDK